MLAQKSKAVTWTLLGLGLPLLLLLMILSLTQGAADIDLGEIVEAFFHFDADNMNHLMVLELRLPRTLTAALLGLALAMAGAVMQGITANPLADSGLMGLSAGGGFALALSMVFFPQISYGLRLVFSFSGSALSAFIVFGLSQAVPGGKGPLKMILAGAALTTLLTALSQGIALYGDVSQSLSFWTLGSVSSTSREQLGFAAGPILLACAFVLLLGRKITLLSLGDEAARALGVKTERLKFYAVTAVVVLAGLSTALAGVISFVGILVPHICRKLVGSDYQYVLPLSGLFGALLLVSADLSARFLFPQSEIPIGTLIALLGVPAFFYFARKERK